MKEYIYEHNPGKHIFIDRYSKGVNPCGTYYSDFFKGKVSFSMEIDSQRKISDVVYKITDSVSGLFYIGKTRWIKRRFHQHQSDIFKCIEAFKLKSSMPAKALGFHQEFASQFIKNKKLHLKFEILYWDKMSGATFHEQEIILIRANIKNKLCLNNTMRRGF